ncbi:MAG: divalent-cation tolerance protein CutA, partial [Alphaproteobacteria bacterium]|nr:divalent-cation tolerance protein CutA [Alphaproteobacteria bacterium]
GVIEQAWEFVLWLKAPEANFAKIETLVKDLHPYDVPAITGMICSHASADFAAWIDENTDT